MNLSKIRGAVRTARRYGMNDREILTILLKNEFGGIHRREIVVEWGKAVGLDESTALRTAKELNLIPSSHSPATWKTKGTLPRTTEEGIPG